VSIATKNDLLLLRSREVFPNRRAAASESLRRYRRQRPRGPRVRADGREMTESYVGYSVVRDTYDRKSINVAWLGQAQYYGLSSECQRAASLNDWAALDRLRRLNLEECRP